MLIEDYVRAGFRKIHLDCSMSCADDPAPLSEETIAHRAARLCAVAERAHAGAGGEPPVYVIGTEVPVPGGAAEELGTLAVTTPEAARATIDIHRAIFAAAGLADVWSRVIAVVVQPGVEFDHRKVFGYVPEKAQALSRMIESCNGLIFEAHSTDYQAVSARGAGAGSLRDPEGRPRLDLCAARGALGLNAIEREWIEPGRSPASAMSPSRA